MDRMTAGRLTPPHVVSDGGRHVLADESGLGLVEMMVAILVTGMVLSAMAASLTTSLRSIQRDELRVVATALGNELLEDLQGLPFRLAAFYSDEATAELGSLTHDGEAVAVIPPDSPRNPAVPEPGVQTVIRAGVSFTVETMITWVDDPADGQGAADPDDTTDYKRFVVDLAWDERGATRTATVEALRAPTATDQPLGTRIEPDIVPITGRPEGKLGVALELVAESQEPQQAVKASFLQRGETTPTEVHLVDGGGGVSWGLTLTAGSHRFANGETLVTFTATAPDGATTTVVDRALFLHDLAIAADEVAVGGVALTSGPEVQVTSAGGCPFDLTASVTGALASDSVRATWTSGPAAGAMLASGTREHGADFVLGYGSGAGFPVPAAEGDTTTTDLSIEVIRGADGAILTFTATGIVVRRVASCS